MWWLLISSTLELPWSEYLNKKYMLASASSLHFHQSTSWNGQSSLATYGNETKLGQNWRTSGAPNFFLVRIITNITALFSNIYWETVRIKNNCLLQCMSIISKPILLYGSDVQLYNEKACQTNIKYIYNYPAHIYTRQYKETKLHKSSRKKFGAPDARQFCPSLVSELLLERAVMLVIVLTMEILNLASTSL
jgi:hypothetical protein